MPKINDITKIFFFFYLLLSSNAFCWTISGNQSVTLSYDQQIDLDTIIDPREAGEYIQQLYEEQKYPYVKLKINPQTKEITVKEGITFISGPYSEYFHNKNLFNQQDFQTATLNIKKAAEYNNEKISINILKMDAEGNVYIDITKDKPKDIFVGDKHLTNKQSTNKDSTKTIGGDFVFTTLGQRYSGPDVATLSLWQNIGNNQQIDFQFAHGFPELRSESKGGGIRKRSN